jgi:hypothetical protein
VLSQRTWLSRAWLLLALRGYLTLPEAGMMFWGR